MDASRYAFGFGAFPSDATLTVDQRAYVTHRLTLTAHDRVIETSIDALGSQNALVREWKGIERACLREERRLARCGGAR